MLYLLYGKNAFLIEQELKKIISDQKIEKVNISEFDLEQTKIESILDDASQLSLFCDKKIVIINNSYLFSSQKKEESSTEIEKYLNNPIPTTIMIFISDKEKLDERKKVTKLMRKNGSVKEYNQVRMETNFVNDLFKGYQISKETINLLISRVGVNPYLLKQEIAKIISYKGEDSVITNDDIKNLTNKNIEEDLFGLIEAIIQKDKQNAIAIYEEIVRRGEEPVKILVTLANQLRLIYQTKELFKKGYTEGDIATLLDIHPYRIKLALSKSTGYQKDDLLNYLKELANLDFKIKSSLIEPTVGLELFILNIK